MRGRLQRSLLAVGLAAGAMVCVAGNASGTPSVTRYDGADRYATSAAIVDANYGPGVSVAFVATGEDYADALAGGATAALDDGPLLLVRHDAIPTSVAAELRRLQPGGIIVLGGPAAISDAVVSSLQSYTTGNVRRMAGNDRYDTAADLAILGPLGRPMYIVTGLNFPDALAASAAAVSRHASILLTRPDALPAGTIWILSNVHPSSITIVGGTKSISDEVQSQLAAYSPVVTRISGADRYATAAALAASTFPSAAGAFVATGNDFADALVGGPIAGDHDEPLLLSAPSCLPSQTADEVATLQPNTVTLLGGTASLGDGVAALTTCPPLP